MELNASAFNVDPVHGALVVSLSVSLEGANPDVAVSATVASKFGFIGKAMIYRGTRVENETPMVVDFNVGMLARPMGLGRLSVSTTSGCCPKSFFSSVGFG